MSKVTKEAEKFFSASAVTVYKDGAAIRDKYYGANINRNLIKYQELTSLKARSKFFIFNSQKALSQIKGYVSNLDSKFTKDIERATYIVVDNINNLHTNFDYCVDVVNNSTGQMEQFLVSEIYPARTAINNSSEYTYSDYNYAVNFTPIYIGEQLNELYQIVHCNATIITSKQLEELSNTSVEFTVEIGKSISKMLRGSESDRLLANETLLNIVPGRYAYEYYKFIRNDISTYYLNRRSKRMRQYIEDNYLYDLASFSPTEYFEFLKRKNKLDARTFYFLEKDIRKTVTVRNGDLYRHTLTLKDEYRNLIIEYHKTNKDESI